jgi:hypothetical protein
VIAMLMKAEWRIRRKVIFATLLFCAVEVGYLTLAGQDTQLHQAIATSLILLAGSVIGSYVFGAIWDDANARKAANEAGPSTTIVATTVGDTTTTSTTDTSAVEPGEIPR